MTVTIAQREAPAVPEEIRRARFASALTSFDENDLCAPSMMNPDTTGQQITGKRDTYEPTSVLDAAIDELNESLCSGAHGESDALGLRSDWSPLELEMPSLPSDQSVLSWDEPPQVALSRRLSDAGSKPPLPWTTLGEDRKTRPKAATLGRLDLQVPVRTSSTKSLLSPFTYQPTANGDGYFSFKKSKKSSRRIIRPTARSPSPSGREKRASRRSPIPRRRLSYEDPPVPPLNLARYALKEQDEEAVVFSKKKTSPGRDHDATQSRLWLDLSEDDEEDDGIEQAQIVKLTASPTKPRVTSITRRRVDASPNTVFLSDAVYKPNTPPDTPQPSPINEEAEGSDAEAVRTVKAGEKLRIISPPNDLKWTMTPPDSNSPVQSDRGEQYTVDASARNRKNGNAASSAKEATPRGRPPTPVPFDSPPSSPPRDVALETESTQIMHRLEDLMGGDNEFPKLRMTSSFVEHLRRCDALMGLLDGSTSLSDRSSAASSPRSLCCSRPLSDVDRLAAKSCSVMGAFSSVFPTTPTPMLESLYATLLALQFVVVTGSGVETAKTPSLVQRPPPLSYEMPYCGSKNSWANDSAHLFGQPQSVACRIPSKAQTLLGLSASASSSSASGPSASSFARNFFPHRDALSARPPVPAYWARQETKSFRARIDDLETKLKSELNSLLDAVLRVRAEGMVPSVEREFLTKTLLEMVKMSKIAPASI